MNNIGEELDAYQLNHVLKLAGDNTSLNSLFPGGEGNTQAHIR